MSTHSVTKIPIPVNATGCRDWWNHLYGDQTGLLCLFSAERVDGQLEGQQQVFMPYPAEVDRAEAWVTDENDHGREVYQCAHLLTRPVRNKAAATPVGTCWVDADGAQPPDDLPPSVVLRTSRGREQLAYQLTHAVSPEVAESLNRRLALHIGADPSGYDLTQLLRVPGTTNHKYPDRPVVTLSYIDDTRRYDPDDLDRRLPPLPAPRTHAAPVGDQIGEGSRNATLASLAGTMRRRGMSSSAIEAALLEENATRCIPPLDVAEVQQIARSVGKYPPAPLTTPASGDGVHEPTPSDEETTPSTLTTHPLTDTGNAERLVARYGQIIRFNWGRNVWHVWSGRHWEEDRTGQMGQLAKETVRGIPQEAQGLEGESYTKVLKWAAASESAGKRAAMIDLARSEPGIPVRPHELDADPWLLNVANGTLDLRTGDLHPHHPNDLITRLIDVPCDPNAPCPTFLSFLSDIFEGNRELIGYVQRIVGYSLTGSIREQMVIIGYGSGSNGKSTLNGTLRRLLGDYAADADADSFMERKSDAIREDIAALDGVRLVAASETSDGKRLSEALVKKMTGGERLRARRLYENGYEFVPQFKVWLSTNHRPQIVGTEHAIWRRIRLIPFNVTISDENRDRDLPEKLEAELPGILAWAVRGCLEWQRIGEAPPAIVIEATDNYRRDMDIIGDWLEDRCELRPGIRDTPKALYADYVAYCELTGETPIKQRTFGTRLTERGCGEEKSNNVRYRTGIRLHDPNRIDQMLLDGAGTQGTLGTLVSGNSPSNASTRDLPESNVPNVPCVPLTAADDAEEETTWEA